MGYHKDQGKKFVDKFAKLIKISFPMECFTADFSHFFKQMSKIAFCVARWVLVIKSKRFLKVPDFLRS